jgi:hypothetical protein
VHYDVCEKHWHCGLLFFFLEEKETLASPAQQDHWLHTAAPLSHLGEHPGKDVARLSSGYTVIIL